MMAYIVSLLIVGLCLYLVIMPLLQPKKKMAEIKVQDDFEDITIENVYATLNELEMDYNMKKLSEEDYQRLKSDYERIAANLIAKSKTEEKAKGSNLDVAEDIEAEIEEELAKLRKERGEG